MVNLADVPELQAHFSGKSLASVPRIDVVMLSARDRLPVGDPVALFDEATAGDAFQYAISVDGAPPELGRVEAPLTPGREELPGAVSMSSVPAAPDYADQDVVYQLRAIVGGRPVELGMALLAPRFGDGSHAGVPVWAVLDALGRLRLHSGYPPYLSQSESLATTEQNPGYVRRLPMDKGLSMWNPQWDPFTGDH
jgi:hypothetical protein